MGFEPTTFCMASRRSSQLSYSRAEASLASGWMIEGQASPKWSSDSSNQASVPDRRVLAPPIVGEPVDQHQPVAAAVVDPVARYGAVGAGIEDLDPYAVGRGSQAYKDGLVRPGAAVLDGVRYQLAQQQRQAVANRALGVPPGLTTPNGAPRRRLSCRPAPRTTHSWSQRSRPSPVRGTVRLAAAAVTPQSSRRYPCQRFGAVAEWLRSGLQSRLHQFDSGRRLRRRAKSELTVWKRVPNVSRFVFGI